MLGLMQDRPLAIPMIFHRMEEVFPQSTITTVNQGNTATVTYGDWARDVRKVASALSAFGLDPGARVATLCANTLEHLMLYFAVPCSGLVLHTVNHRLSSQHIDFILEDADVRVLVIDRALTTLLPSLTLSGIDVIVVVGGVAGDPDPRMITFDSLLREPAHEGDFFVNDENRAASICHTSGTTGRPKGVVYSHRSVVLVALMALSPDVFGLCTNDVVMPIVPMFHANAWGLPYAAALVGSNLVLPGHGRSSAELVSLLQNCEVSVAAAVPSVWRDMLPYASGQEWTSLRRLLTGGGPLSVSLSRAWRESTGLALSNSWGMTELGPIGSVSGLRSHQARESCDARLGVLSRAGYPGPLVRLRIGDTAVAANTIGELQVSGPTVASAYLGDVGATRFTADGWLRTGDLAMLRDGGELRITDRLKDVIKSGGEWISSIDLENAIMEHPDVAEAAVIAVQDERWDERPVAFIVPRPGAHVSPEDLAHHLRDRVAKFWIPDRLIVRSDLPRTATGKISKSDLRDEFAVLERSLDWPSTPSTPPRDLLRQEKM